jgi:hypothetical protein
MVSDGENGLHAINVTDFRDIKERLFNSSAFPTNALDPAFQANFNLTLALRDPLTPFDRANVKINGNQATLQITTFPVGENQKLLRIARGRQLDKLADSSGRTLRDSTAVGAGALSRAEMDKMRKVNVVVEPGTSDDKGNGLGNIVFQSLSTNSAPDIPEHAALQSRHKKERALVAGSHSHDQTLGIAAMMMTMMTAISISLFRHRKRNKKRASL